MKDPKVKLAVVSGYEPFGGYLGNPSARIAKKLHRGMIEDIHVAGTVLSNVYTSHERLMGEVERERKRAGLSAEEPVVVISGGLSSSIRELSLEAFGWNEIISKYADADGALVDDGRAVVPGAVGAYRTNADLVAVSVELDTAGVPAKISTDPGRFTCNSIAYGMMHLLAESRAPILFMFYHTGLHEGDLAGELPPEKIYHPPEWLERGIPVMIKTLARQAEAMLAAGQWSFPMPEDRGMIATRFYIK